jgi:hypothetical protein
MNTLWQSNFGTDFDRLAEHTIQFVSTTGTGGTNTYDFVVDGVVVYNDAVYAFNDDTVRNIEMVSTLPNDAADAYQVLYDDLGVLPHSTEPPKTYAQWATDNGLTGDAALRTADPDLDGMDNLLEYALGGDPNVDDATAKLPVSGIVENGGTNWFGYVYNRRRDAATRGLDYSVIIAPDLVFGPWTNIGTSAEYDAAIIDANFESVTNILSTTEDKKFVGLEVTEN